jgi:hypothetical protein
MSQDGTSFVSASIAVHVQRSPARSGAAFAGDLRAGHLGQIEPEAAPAAANVEDTPGRLQEQLCRQVALLRELCVVKRLPRMLEIGAAILPVSVVE